MKTKICLALLIGMLSFSISYAVPNKIARENSKKELVRTDREVGRTLENLFSKAPLEDLMTDKEVITIEFKINEESKMTNIKVKGENKELANYVYQKLTEEPVSLEYVSPEKYAIDMVFVLKK